MVGVSPLPPNAPPPPGAPLAAACSCASLPPPGPAWELRLLFDLVCFGLLIKHVLCFVGGASRSGAARFTHPLYSFLSHRCAAAAPRGGARGAGGPGPAPAPLRGKEPSNPPSSSQASPRHSRAFSPFCTSVAVPPPCPFPPFPPGSVSSRRSRPAVSGALSPPLRDKVATLPRDRGPSLKPDFRNLVTLLRDRAAES